MSKKQTWKSTLSNSKKFRIFKISMLCAVIGTTFATSVAALVLQLKNEHPQQIILGDSITITSKNADSISKQVQKRIEHTYIPRLANFNATDITVGEANYNLNFNDGSQVYWELLSSFCNSIKNKECSRIELEFYSSKWVIVNPSGVQLRNGFIKIDNYCYDFSNMAADFTYSFNNNAWHFNISPSTPSPDFPQTLTYVSSTYKNFSLRTIPTDLSDDDMQNSVDIDNPADGSSWQTSLKEHYDELVGTTFLNPVTDEYPTFNDFIGQAFKQSAEIGVSPNDHVFRDMLYTDIISSLAVTVATHNSNISIDEIPGFWTDKEFGNQFEQAPVFGSAPFLPDFTNSSYLDWDCRFNDTSLFLENDCNSSIPDKGNIPMMWYPERSSGPGPYSFNAAETNENIIDARQDKVWFASQDDNGVHSQDMLIIL